jgi:spoIIIJ-associated protein
MTSPQPADLQLEQAQQWLCDVLKAMGIPAEVEIAQDPVVGTVLQIKSDSLSDLQRQALMDHQFAQEEGSESSIISLDSLQFLMNTVLNLHQPKEEQRSYQIDLDGHRARRQQELESQAQAAAEQVRSTGQSTEMKGLSAAERRQVHTYLSLPQFEDLATESQGREPDRRLLIQLVAKSDPSPDLSSPDLSVS